MTTFVAKFSNGSGWSQNSKSRKFTHAWRVEWDEKFTGGFSCDAVNAAKAMNAKIGYLKSARTGRPDVVITFKEVTEVKEA